MASNVGNFSGISAEDHARVMRGAVGDFKDQHVNCWVIEQNGPLASTEIMAQMAIGAVERLSKTTLLKVPENEAKELSKELGKITQRGHFILDQVIPFLENQSENKGIDPRTKKLLAKTNAIYDKFTNKGLSSDEREELMHRKIMQYNERILNLSKSSSNQETVQGNYEIICSLNKMKQALLKERPRVIKCESTYEDLKNNCLAPLNQEGINPKDSEDCFKAYAPTQVAIRYLARMLQTNQSSSSIPEFFEEPGAVKGLIHRAHAELVSYARSFHFKPENLGNKNFFTLDDLENSHNEAYPLLQDWKPFTATFFLKDVGSMLEIYKQYLKELQERQISNYLTTVGLYIECCRGEEKTIFPCSIHSSGEIALLDQYGGHDQIPYVIRFADVEQLADFLYLHPGCPSEGEKEGKVRFIPFLHKYQYQVMALREEESLEVEAEQTLSLSGLEKHSSDLVTVMEFSYDTKGAAISICGNIPAMSEISWNVKETMFLDFNPDTSKWILKLPKHVVEAGKGEYKLNLDGVWEIIPRNKNRQLSDSNQPAPKFPKF